MIQRTTAYKKLINSQKWVKLRAEKLRNNPLCERCKLSGIITPGAEVHHIAPVDTGATTAEMLLLAYNPGNLQTLCHKCHVLTHTELLSKSAATNKARNAARAAGFINQFLSVKK
jgi:5-methylcytosine-specific restriction endonuclease McrA